HKKSLEEMGMEVFGLNFGNDEEEETIEDYKPRPLKEIEISVNSTKYEPNSIVVDEGDKVVLKIKAVDHGYGIVCPSYGIKDFLPPGELVIEEVFPDQPGEFGWFNDVPAGPGWREMRGKIVVKETELGKAKREKKGDGDILG
ncbi:cupredoxin domain-containing protein, partial [Nanoarchaeota archaeon]